MKCNEVWTAPFLLQQILSLGDPILHNQAELIATTGRGGEGGAEKRKGENEARKGERKEGKRELRRQSEKLLPSSCFHYMRLGNLEWPADTMKANLEPQL